MLPRRNSNHQRPVLSQQLDLTGQSGLPSGFRFCSLPVELRLQVYREAWKSTIILVSFHGCWQPLQVMKRGKMPATLHLCLEARQETLKYYHLYKASAAKLVAPKISFTQCGYINPNLDIIHLDVPFGSGPVEGHIQIERLSPATLRLTLGRALVPSAVLKWFAEKPQLFAGLKTIDFWVWTPSRMFENGVTERYRICRLPPSTPLTPVVHRKNIVYKPAAVDSRLCPNSHCQTPIWHWKYDPEASYCVASTGPYIISQRPFVRGEEIKLPDPDGSARVVMPSISFDWKATRARALLRETDVLLFDPGDGMKRREWVICKVVDPSEIPNKLVIQLGARYLLYLDWDLAHYATLLQQREITALMEQHPDTSQFLTEMLPMLDHLSITRYSRSPPLGPDWYYTKYRDWEGCKDVAHGVCGPGWLYAAGQSFPLQGLHQSGVEELYPKARENRIRKVMKSREVIDNGGKGCQICQGFLPINSPGRPCQMCWEIVPSVRSWETEWSTWKWAPL